MGPSTYPEPASERPAIGYDAPEGHVLHIIRNLDVGGAQEVVASLAPALLQHGWRASVATLRDGPYRSRIEGAGIPVFVLPERTRPVTTGVGAARDIGALRRRLVSLVAEQRVDVVQTHLMRSMDLLVLSLGVPRRSRPLATLWTMHNARLALRADQVPHPASLPLRNAAYRWSYRVGSMLGGRFVAVSDEVATSIRTQYRISPSRVHVIPNGVDVSRFGRTVDRASVRSDLGVEPEAPVVIVVAKLFPQKGHEDLLTALTQLRPDRPDVRVLLVGEGPLREALEERVAALRLGDVVRFLGVRSDIPTLLAAADLFVLPSHWEGLPVALLEAMAAGVPVVATRVSGSVEVVEDGVSGRLVPPGEPGQLAEAIRSVLQDPVSARRLSEAGRARVEAEFSVDRQARRHADLYARLMRTGRAA